jgi:hypothetical protein
MGHGRRTAQIVRSFLLIVSAIQGITPDARDLASSLALRILGPSILETSTLAHDDAAAKDLCIAVRPAPSLPACRENGSPTPTYLASRALVRAATSGPLAPRLSTVRDFRRGPNFHEKVCRLVC